MPAYSTRVTQPVLTDTDVAGGTSSRGSHRRFPDRCVIHMQCLRKEPGPVFEKSVIDRIPVC